MINFKYKHLYEITTKSEKKVQGLYKSKYPAPQGDVMYGFSMITNQVMWVRESQIVKYVDLSAPTPSEFYPLPPEMPLADVQAFRIQEIKDMTFAYVDAKMPAWRQSSWNMYRDVSNKVAMGIPLDPLEKAFYASFPNPGQTHVDAYMECLEALGWILQCVAANDVVENQIKTMTDKDAIMQIVPTYPEWPL